MPEPAPSRVERFALRAKAVVPRPVKSLLRPVVRPFLTPPRAPERKAFAAADNWVGNRWTIDVYGRTFKFFFINGCYKSGTHWVQNILNLHPAVNVKGEFHFETLWEGYKELTSIPWFLSSKQPVAAVATESVEDMVRRMMYSQLSDKPGVMWLGDRTPRALEEFLPGAPNISIRRDGRDVMVSWNFHHLRVPEPSRFMPRFRSLAERMCPDFRADPSKYEKKGMGFLTDEGWFRHHASLWATIVRSEIDSAPIFRERGTPVLQVRYEHLQSDVHAQAERLYRFFDLNPAEAFPLSEESKTLPGFKNSSPLKFMRKGVTGEWKEYFDQNQTRWFKEEAGEALIASGYEKDLQW